MHSVVETIRRIARHEARQGWNTALAVVKSVHGRNGETGYACTVELRETRIVLPRVPIATGFIGSVALPRENDLVLVLFVGGDLHAPVVVGRLYNEEVAPPVHGPEEVVVSLPGDEEASDKVVELRVATPRGGPRNVTLTLDGQVKVEVEVKDDGVRIQAQDVVLKLSQSGSADGTAELSAGGSSLKLSQSGDIEIDASGKLSLKAAEVEISGDATVKVAGQTIDLN